MAHKNGQSVYYLLVKITAIVAIIGAGLLLYTGIDTPGTTVFSLIAFTISVVALVMTTLQSVLIARQVRVTERAARLVHETGLRLERLETEDRLLERDIRKDILLDREIIGVLEEFGIGDNEEERKKVAQHISHKVKRTAKVKEG